MPGRLCHEAFTRGPTPKGHTKTWRKSPIDLRAAPPKKGQSAFRWKLDQGEVSCAQAGGSRELGHQRGMNASLSHLFQLSVVPPRVRHMAAAPEHRVVPVEGVLLPEWKSVRPSSVVVLKGAARFSVMIL